MQAHPVKGKRAAGSGRVVLVGQQHELSTVGANLDNVASPAALLLIVHRAASHYYLDAFGFSRRASVGHFDGTGFDGQRTAVSVG